MCTCRSPNIVSNQKANISIPAQQNPAQYPIISYAFILLRYIYSQSCAKVVIFLVDTERKSWLDRCLFACFNDAFLSGTVRGSPRKLHLHPFVPRRNKCKRLAFSNFRRRAAGCFSQGHFGKRAFLLNRIESSTLSEQH